MPIRNLYIIIQPVSDAIQEGRKELPGLERLLRGGRHQAPCASLAEAACQAFGIARQQDWPIAPFTARAAGLDVGDGYWLRLDPVHLDVGMHGLFLRGEQTLDTQEARTLLHLVSPLLLEAGLETQAGEDGLLYVRAATPPRLATTPLDQVDGRQPTRFLPTGEDATAWSRRLHEIQMALHDHPINTSRMAAGRLPINSLWPWGGGRLVQPPPGLDAVWADAPLPRQMAAALGIACHGVPSGLGQVLADGGTRGLVVLGGHRDGFADPHELHRNWERQWFGPLLRALRLGRIASLRVTRLGDTPGTRRLTPWDAWRLWA